MTTDAYRPTVAFLYGIGEGKRISKKFRACLATHGFRHIEDPAQADIWVVHSAGVLAIPQSTQRKTILIVGGITGWEGPLRAAMVKKVRQDYRAAWAARQLHRWLLKSIYNTGYLVRQSPGMRKLRRLALQQRLILPDLTNCRIAVVMLKDDPWSGHLGKHDFHNRLPYTFVQFDHLHDDLWQRPEDYVQLLAYLHSQDQGRKPFGLHGSRPRA